MEQNTPNKNQNVKIVPLYRKKDVPESQPQLVIPNFNKNSREFNPENLENQQASFPFNESLSSIQSLTSRSIATMHDSLFQFQPDQRNLEMYNDAEEYKSTSDPFYSQSGIDQESEVDFQTQDIIIIPRSYKRIVPYKYQVEIFCKIREDWDNLSPPHYGHIVYLETGMGKTHIATMLLNYLFEKVSYDQDESLVPKSQEELRSRINQRDKEFYLSQTDISIEKVKRKKVFFIVPVQNLIEQQAATIERYTNLVVGRYLGRQKKSSKCYSELEAWREEFDKHDVFVAMAKKFYDLLMHGFTKMEEIDLIVFDECHHTDQDHLYNLIMRDFFYHKFEPENPNCRRPKILGLTASPIKQKIERVLAQEIESMLQNLANNLYSRFLTISADQLQNIENNLSIQIKDFDSNFNENVIAIDEIESLVIRRIAKMVSLPEGSYKMQHDVGIFKNKQRKELEQAQLIQLIQDTTFEVAQQEQDNTVTQFLRGRRNLIELNCGVTKTELDISKLEQQEEKVLLILCLIILKKVNSLLIELGQLAVKIFMMDLKHDLLKSSNNVLGDKRNQTVEIIDNYCKKQMNESQASINFSGVDETGISNKVRKLSEILRDSYKKDRNLKTIIFVKDRSVAVYLQKILSGNQVENSLTQAQLDEAMIEGENNSYISKGILDARIFRIGFAMGIKRMSLINQAYRSTNIKNTDIFKDVLNSIPSCNSIKLSQSQFKDTLDKFNSGEINVLIATNVVEEGLDVSTCNLVICLNELSTVKTFIQMKGRARQDKSQFIFLCAKEELQQVKIDQESFGKVIELMKHIALRGFKPSGSGANNAIVTAKNELVPLPNICALKQQEEGSYLEEPKTGAKISMRDAKQLVEFFCIAYADIKIKMQKMIKHDSNMSNSTEASNSGKHLELKPNYVSEEHARDGVKFFFTILYMPETCKDIVRKVNPKSAFVKKKDSENHVALLAIKKLRDKGYLDEHLFPVLPGENSQQLQRMFLNSLQKASSSFDQSSQLNESSSSISQLQMLHSIASQVKQKNAGRSIIMNGDQMVDLSQPRKKKHITDEQKSAAQQESKQFQQTLKNELSKFNIDNGGSDLVNELVFKSNWQTLKVMIFKGKAQEFNYPFKNTRDFLGVLCNQQNTNFSSPEIVFDMHQETKQREKNSEHLYNLSKNGLISELFRQAAEQACEVLPVTLNQHDSFRLIQDMLRQNIACKEDSQIQVALFKLQFFHVWIYYYFYSADHKFIKAILKQKFPFALQLFPAELDLLRRRHLSVVKSVYGDKTAQALRQESRKEKFGKNHFAYTVPVFQRGQLYYVNWSVIEKTLNYVKNQLLDLTMPTERHVVIAKYNLEEVYKQKNQGMIDLVWDNRFGGNRHIVVDWEPAFSKWYEPMDYSGGKPSDQKQFADKIRQDLLELRMYELAKSRSLDYQKEESKSLNDTMNLSYFSSDRNQSVDPENDFIVTTKQTMLTPGMKQDMREMSKLDKERKIVTLTHQEYYFIKQGQLQLQRFNRVIFKCRKERHFVDFANKRRDELLDQSKPGGGMQAQNSFFSSKNQSQLVPKKVNTIFDVPEQQLSLSPLTYNQYQVLQQSCFHLLNLNEFMLIENFIANFFAEGTCLVEQADIEGDLVPSEHQKRLFETQQQIWEDVKSSQKVLQVSTQQQLKRKVHLVREALTAPSACRDYDYERLEFYGDSIVGFLVILELFVMNKDRTEGDLDFLRIARVSNENFYKINMQNNFHKFMITEPHHIFQGFTPAGFEKFEQQAGTKLHYMNKVTQKQYNELNNKMKEIRKVQERLKLTNAKDDEMKQMFLRGNLFTLVQILLKDVQMVKKIAYQLTQHNSKIHNIEHSKDYSQKQKHDCCCLEYQQKFEALALGNNTKSILKAIKILQKAQLTPIRILRYCTDVVASRVQTQIQKAREMRNKKTAENERIVNFRKRPVYYKQLADIVESVVGAVTLSCGINFTQEFLLKLGVLHINQQRLLTEIDLLSKSYLMKEQNLIENFYLRGNQQEVEKIIGYTFRCKSYLVTALTHKSYIDQQIESRVGIRLEDYERLEFLGDSILNYMIAKHFFLTTQDDAVKKMPKELHKMKTAVINNALLSLIVIEKGIHNFIIYNVKAEQFRKQFEKFVTTVIEMVRPIGTIELSQRSDSERNHLALDLDELYEHNLKIFGDVFESLIGAVFLDCRDTERTWAVLEKLIMPYIKVYADLETMQDHHRTKLLELWNQRSYTKRFKCTHESQSWPGSDQIVLTAVLVGFSYNSHNRYVIFEEVFNKDAKNKNRAFYKILYGVVEKFIRQIDQKGPDEERLLNKNPELVVDGLRKIIIKQRQEEEDYHRKLQQQAWQINFNVNTPSFNPADL